MKSIGYILKEWWSDIGDFILNVGNKVFEVDSVAVRGEKAVFEFIFNGVMVFTDVVYPWEIICISGQVIAGSSAVAIKIIQLEQYENN
ncbi:hypothetical protein [Xenorhabdus szentirmaii]|uniref:Phage protein n=1 Tax=Xenorhabdus szentirmaii TaxID=290112 RepID=A0AAW3YPF3_9GAMM|nr:MULTISPECIES: hypothetical protein [Xenorhabdus]MBD2779129.1 hypothetical protein [Xenorhabdus sp. 38]MBD2793236.1 hypothetical protein [Xenorhabdus sp. CUL]MBD2799029.1 hypothetical protein [Xenorhabdus sp. M]MBD2803391.1 hypothetical protein [Xenorhabdus sp. ZM]MBD2820074.1 hypothetical protein [Xenorhabdus sp. 42]